MMMVVMLLTSIAHITLDAILNTVLKTIHQHLTTNNSACTTQQAHRHFTIPALQETTLLTLRWHIRRSRHDASQICTTAVAILSANRSHRHAGWAAQDHWWLTNHWLRLISTLSILLWHILLWRILLLLRRIHLSS